MEYNLSGYGLGGINSAAADLAAASNNIANSNTTGFKKTRMRFNDIFTTTNNQNSPGGGVRTTDTQQQFAQGSLEVTENTLDLAIKGKGFFIVAAPPKIGSLPTTPTTPTTKEMLYTRAGSFAANKDGYIANGAGQLLQGFKVDSDGNVVSPKLVDMESIRIPTEAGDPRSSTTVQLGVNLNAEKTGLNPAIFDRNNFNTFTHSASVKVYDSLGEGHTAVAFFIKDQAATSTWQVRFAIDDKDVTPASDTTMTFNGNGFLTSPASKTMQTTVFTPTGVDAKPMTLTWNFDNGTSQFSSAFNMTKISQDGFSVGYLNQVDIDEAGVIEAGYTNGTVSRLGVLGIAGFHNNEGLQNIGSGVWGETFASGVPSVAEARSGNFGGVQSGALEKSNVDSTSELLKIIQAQRHYQANAKTIEVAQQMTQEAMNWK